MKTTTTPALTAAAVAQLAAATTALAAIGLTPNQLRNLLRASEIAACCADTEAEFGEPCDLAEFADSNEDCAQEEWHDEIRDAAAHLTRGRRAA